MGPTITAVETVTFEYPVDHVAPNPLGTGLQYRPGARTDLTTYAVRIETDTGVSGEYVGGTAPGMAQVRNSAGALLGRDALERERIWDVLKRTLRKFDGTGIGPIDIALWDLAGTHHGASVHELLGTYRTRLPAYVSTHAGGEEGGLDTPTAYADFAAEIRDRGFPAYKLHTWRGLDDVDIEREIATVRAVAERVGDDMDLMHDPVCEYETYGDALAVGRELDRGGYYWYEDPYRDGSKSQHAHRRLADRLDTPLLLTEQTRWLEPHADAIANDATDFVRADPDLDGGITGAMKIAHVAEGFGLDVEYHLASPASRHCMAATRNTNYYELGLVAPQCPTPHSEPPVYDTYTDSLDAAEDGRYPVPDGDGLGVTYDWEYIRDAATASTRVEG